MAAKINNLSSINGNYLNNVENDMNSRDFLIKNNKELTSYSTSNKNNIYDYFLIIGASNKSLDTINESELLLTPKFLFSYPNYQDAFKEFEFYRHCCYKNGIKVKRIEISNEEDYSSYLLESNLYSSPIETFSFIKSSDNQINNKYIFGMKFYDIYIFNPKLNNKNNNNKFIYIYMKKRFYLYLQIHLCNYLKVHV